MRIVRTSSVVLVLLAACQPGPPPKHVASPPPAVAATPQVHGRALYLERMLMPPGATLEVMLIAQSGDAEPTAVASQPYTDLHGPPYDFDLAYDPSLIATGAHCSLRAQLRDADGHLAFATDARVPVVPGDAHRIEFRLVRTAAQ